MPKALPMDSEGTNTPQGGTRSWAEAEQVKHDWRTSSRRAPNKPESVRGLQDCIDLFIQDKKYRHHGG